MRNYSRSGILHQQCWEVPGFIERKGEFYLIDEKRHYDQLIQCLKDMIVYRNIDSIQHIEYVQKYTRILATEYAKLYPRSRMTEPKINIIVEAAGLHDIGKLALPDTVIGKKEKRSKSENILMQQHTVRGSEMIGRLFEFRGEQFCRICRNVCLYHHEKYDGTGYPDKLRKDRIPIEAQLVGLADMYDTLLHNDQNNVFFTKEKAYYMLMKGECGMLSPRMKECFESAKTKMEGCCP